ncbi:AI-2E family transporter [Acetomicrobium sp.]|uniref:AI-2E family transporter n=1 Tax=Acetomicrobium sp. TaxID=1872099 RepID=UPI002871FC2A|nr:AI-2E family transporter [Acetomicrobium sp.]MDR9769915.1 AI-2E family transporter [Acetomicrobium sp.]
MPDCDHNSPKTAKDSAFTMNWYRYQAPLLLLGFLCIVAGGAVLRSARSVVMPLVIAWLLSFIFKPAVLRLEKRKVPRGLAVSLLLTLFLVICLLAFALLYRRILPFVNAFPGYYARFMNIVQEIGQKTNLPTDVLMEFDLGRRLTPFLFALPAKAISLISNLFLIIVFLIFILLGSPASSEKLKRAFSPTTADRVQQIVNAISKQIGRYLLTTVIISALTGIAVWLALVIINVDFAVNWGVLAFVLNFIPYVGSLIASIPPILVAIVQFYPDIRPAVTTSLALLAIQTSIGNLLAPKVVGDALNINPIVVLLSLLFWGWLWGGVGAVLAVPIVVVIKITCENVPILRPIAILMESRQSKVIEGPA